MKRAATVLGLWTVLAASCFGQATSTLDDEPTATSDAEQAGELKSAVLDAKQAAIDAREAAIKAGEAALRAQGGTAAAYQGTDTQVDTPQQRRLETARRTSEHRRARIEWRRWMGQPASRPNFSVNIANPVYDSVFYGTLRGGFLAPSAYGFYPYGAALPNSGLMNWYGW